MKFHRIILLVTSIGLPSLFLFINLFLLQHPARSAGFRFVASSGSDENNACLSSSTPCRTVQHAIDQAVAFDEIRVASGFYTNNGTVVSLTKTLSLLGGWNDLFAVQDPASYPTVLDAQGLASVVFISGSVTPTLDGFTITGGDAASTTQAGGGIYSFGASPIIVNNVITGNVANSSGTGMGGGLYLDNSGYALIQDNQFVNNTAGTSTWVDWCPPSFSFGGALYLTGETGATRIVSGNLFLGNQAESASQAGYGGALFVGTGPVQITSNHIISNVAGRTDSYCLVPRSSSGGGVFLNAKQIVLSRNLIQGNVATQIGSGLGGGMVLDHSTASLDSNDIISNIATLSEGFIGSAGGIDIYYSEAELTGNLIAGNAAAVSGTTASGGTAQKSGGGIRGYGCVITATRNVIRSNSVVITGERYTVGNAMFLDTCNVQFVSNRVQDNPWAGADGASSAIYLYLDPDELYFNPNLNQPSVFENNLLSGNKGDGLVIFGFIERDSSIVNNTFVGSGMTSTSGVYLNGPFTASLTNNIFTWFGVGITATNEWASQSISASQSYNLFWNNEVDYSGTLSNTHLILDDPCFEDNDYHLCPGSPAIDAGDPRGVPPAPGSDLEGNPRPIGERVDLGAYEEERTMYLPIVLRTSPWGQSQQSIGYQGRSH